MNSAVAAKPRQTRAQAPCVQAIRTVVFRGRAQASPNAGATAHCRSAVPVFPVPARIPPRPHGQGSSICADRVPAALRQEKGLPARPCHPETRNATLPCRRRPAQVRTGVRCRLRRTPAPGVVATALPRSSSREAHGRRCGAPGRGSQACDDAASRVEPGPRPFGRLHRGKPPPCPTPLHP
jgi:hypothetical protein